jgi:NADPH:quinone reductase
MRAIVIERYGGPEVLQRRSDVAVPTPAPDEVLVKVACAGAEWEDAEDP